MSELSLQDDMPESPIGRVATSNDYQERTGVIGTVIDTLATLFRVVLSVFIVMSTLAVAAGAIFCKVARSRGTTFNLILERDGLKTEF